MYDRWVWLLCALGITSWLITGLVRRYALRHAVVDVPNERSSHRVVTPRGGGAAIAILVLAFIGAAWWNGFLGGPLAAALVGGGSLVALIGWLDDSRPVAPVWRALVHTIAAVWAVYWLGGLPDLRAGASTVTLGAAGFPLAVFGMVGAVNFYNFMDGSDGMAAGQAVSVAGVGGALLHAGGHDALALVCWVVAATAAGFLAWNWAPAKIFMGDVGSGFLGFVFACIALASENTGAVPALIWMILLGVFIVDPTLTLLRRMGRGERWHSAHRSHAYQRLLQRGHGHREVILMVLGINGLLSALAWMTYVHAVPLLPVLGVAVALLAFCYGWIETRQPM